MKLYRSLLYVPADNPHRVEKALNSNADVVILDLEDAVAVSKKESSRRSLNSLLKGSNRDNTFVRVNAMSTAFCLEDIAAAVEAGAIGISLPKVESAEEVYSIDWLLNQLEIKEGILPGSIELIPVIESGRGLHHAVSILECVKRVRRAGLGVGDLALEMNFELESDQGEAIPYKRELILASSAAKIEAPLDSVYLDIKNLNGLKSSCLESKRMGFQGRRIIHPSHIDIVNASYSPTDSEIEWARKTILAFNDAEKAGTAAIRVNDSLVDYPIAYRAKTILTRLAEIEQNSVNLLSETREI